MVNWAKVFSGCHDTPYMGKIEKSEVIFVHLLSYPVVFWGFYLFAKRYNELKYLNCNITVLLISMAFEMMGPDFFFADHVNELWYAKYESGLFAGIGFVTVVASNVFKAIGFYGNPSIKENNQPSKKLIYIWIAGITSIVLAGIFFYLSDPSQTQYPLIFRGLCILIQVLTATAVYHQMLYTLPGISKIAHLFMMFGAIGGITAGLLAITCNPYVHMLDASIFACAGASFNIAIAKFTINNDYNITGDIGITLMENHRKLSNDSNNSNNNDMVKL